MMKEKFVAEGGIEASDQEVEKWAAPWEAGKTPGRSAGFVSGPGRPRLSDQETKLVAFRLPVSMVEAIDNKAKKNGETRSQRIREALLSDLMDSSE